LAESIDALSRAAEKAATDAKWTNPGAGRKPKTDTKMLRLFLNYIWDAAAVGNGRLTLDKNKTGTLIEFLNRLRRYLPHEFLPRKHSASTYYAFKKRWSHGRTAPDRN
jgi:hypothetical protein